MLCATQMHSEKNDRCIFADSLKTDWCFRPSTWIHGENDKEWSIVRRQKTCKRVFTAVVVILKFKFLRTMKGVSGSNGQVRPNESESHLWASTNSIQPGSRPRRSNRRPVPSALATFATKLNIEPHIPWSTISPAHTMDGKSSSWSQSQSVFEPYFLASVQKF